MRGSFLNFRIAVTGMHTARANLNVTAHNVANYSNPHFSRQHTVQSAHRAMTMGDGRGMWGMGSMTHNVLQTRDQFIDRRFWAQSSRMGEFRVKQSHMSLIETMFDDLSETGLLNSFNDFFSRMQELSRESHDPTFRLSVVRAGETLTRMIRTNAQQLQQQQRDVNSEIRFTVMEINSLGQQITSINAQIHRFELDGSWANDLRDQRVALVDRLSELVNVETRERDMSAISGVPNDRRFSVLINGYDFVNHRDVSPLAVQPRTAAERRNEMDVDGLYTIRFANGASFNYYNRNLQGALRGLIDVRDGNGGISTVLSATGQHVLTNSGMNPNLSPDPRFQERLIMTLERMGLLQDRLIDIEDQRTALETARNDLTAQINGLIALPIPVAPPVAFDRVAAETARANLPAARAALAALVAQDPPATVADINAAQQVVADYEADWGLHGDRLTQIENLEAQRDIIEAQLDTMPMRNALESIVDNLYAYNQTAIMLVDEAIGDLQARIDALNQITPPPPGLAGLIAPYQAMIGILEGHRNTLVDFAEDIDDIRELFDEEPLVIQDIIDAIQDQLDEVALGGDIHTLINTTIPAQITATLPAGEYRHVQTTRYKGIPFFFHRLNDMVRVFTRAINEGLDNNGDPIPGTPGHRNGFNMLGGTGVDFFSWTDRDGQTVPGTSAHLHMLNALNFNINEELLREPRLLATSTGPVQGESANPIVLGFINVRDFPHLFREGNLLDYIIATAGHLAIDLQQSDRLHNNYRELTNQTQNHRQMVSGVNMNEELFNMSRFYGLFNANARFIQTMNQVYDTLINRIGI